MDLIYTDENLQDIGILNFYDLDLAYGRDENSFSLNIPLKKHCCNAGYYIYIEGTEYGGIIDSIKIDTKKDTVTYNGRTWHGVLNSKVIEKAELLSGDANEVINAILTGADFTDLFYAEGLSDIYINNWEPLPYEPVYDAIVRMLKNYTAKLQIKFNGVSNLIKLQAISRIDYINDDYFDSDELDFIAEKSNKIPNHIICNMENDTEKKRIDIFTDADGVVQPYQKSESLEDNERYYLDKSQQVIFGKDEIIEVISSGIEIRESYHALESIPRNWISNFENYWHQEVDDDGAVSYKQNEYIKQIYYVKLTNEPEDWDLLYNNYFVKNEIQNEYNPVNSVNNNNYVVVANKPDQWEEEYSSYFYKENGVYKNVEGIDDASLYTALDKPPADWGYNYGAYFRWQASTSTFVNVTSTQSKPEYKVPDGRPDDWDNVYSSYWYKATKYKKDKIGSQYRYIEDGSVWLTADKYLTKENEVKTYDLVPNYYQGKYYEKTEVPIAPFFVVGAYYSKNKDAKAPAFNSNTFYIETTTPAAPTFEANKYYVQRVNNLAKVWLYGQYFRKQEDNYIIAIENAIERLEELKATASALDIELPTIYNYDIGDVVGATEHVTNITVSQLITKKIIKIKNGIVEVSYEIGKEK